MHVSRGLHTRKTFVITWVDRWRCCRSARVCTALCSCFSRRVSALRCVLVFFRRVSALRRVLVFAVDAADLEAARRDVTLELLWVQQAIASRKQVCVRVCV